MEELRLDAELAARLRRATRAVLRAAVVKTLQVLRLKSPYQMNR